MGNFLSYQHDGSDVITAEQAGLPTKDRPNGESTPLGIEPNVNQQYNFRMQQGAEAAEEQHIADANDKIASFIDELDRIEVLRASGEPIDSAKKAYIRGTMTDIAIAAVDRCGFPVDHPALEGLRARVGQLIGQ